MFVPSLLVAHLHGLAILTEPLALLVTLQSLRTQEIYQNDSRENGVLHSSYNLGHEKLTTDLLQEFHSCGLFFITEKVFRYYHKWKPCPTFLNIHLSDKVLITIKCKNPCSIKLTCLDLLESKSTENRVHVLETFTVCI